MQQFKIRQEGLKELRNTILIKSIPFSLIVVFGGLGISYFNPNIQQNGVNVFPYIIPIVLLIVAVGLYNGINRQKEIFESYILTIDSYSITREQHNTPTISISKTEISEIIKNSNGSFTIKWNSNADVIGVPKQIEDYQNLEKALVEIRQFSTKSSEPFLQKFHGLITLVSVGLMVAVFLSKNKIIVGICGTILLVVLGTSFFEIQRNKNIDSKTKNGMWGLILVTASIVGIMYYKIDGFQ